MLFIGGVLVAILLLLLAVPCERGRCLLPDGAAGGHATADYSNLPEGSSPATLLHCALHCGLLLVPLLIVVASPAILARLPIGSPEARLLLTAPPLLPPPQAV